LPDELLGRYLGLTQFGQVDLGPQDAITPGVSDLLDALSPSRLMGLASPISASFATIPSSLITSIPQTTGLGCGQLGIVPTDYQLGIQNNIPSDFNPRPKTLPTPAQ
jgi:phospholipase C